MIQYCVIGEVEAVCFNLRSTSLSLQQNYKQLGDSVLYF